MQRGERGCPRRAGMARTVTDHVTAGNIWKVTGQHLTKCWQRCLYGFRPDEVNSFAEWLSFCLDQVELVQRHWWIFGG